MQPNLNNKYLKQLFFTVGRRKSKTNLEGVFYEAKKEIWEKLCQDSYQIINNREIVFELLFPDEDFVKKSTDWRQSFLSHNDKLFFISNNMHVLDKELTDRIVFFLEKAQVEANETRAAGDTRYDFKDVVEATDDEETENAELIDALSKSTGITQFSTLKANAGVKENETKFSYASLMLNYFYTRDIFYVFNKDILTASLKKNASLFTCTFDVISLIQTIEVPIRKRVLCTAKTEFGMECGNIVTFCDMHKHSNIKCTDSMQTPRHQGHAIKAFNEARYDGDDMITMYIYSVRETDEESFEEKRICSLIELSSGIVTANVLTTGEKDEIAQIAFAVKKDSMQSDLKLKGKFLIKNRVLHKNFLNDIFESAKQYLKEYHNISLYDMNRIVAQYLILQYLCNVYFDYAYKTAIFGKSGSGKTIWTKLLFPLLTPAFSVVSGSDISRNRLLGGKSNYASTIFNSPYSPGFIATNDVVFLEESTNQLNMFYEAQKSGISLRDNIFSMLKLVGDKGDEYDIGIQGSQKTRVKASTVLVGNLEQLSLMRKEYVQILRRHYQKFNIVEKKEAYSLSWPLYRPIEYYMRVMSNVPLAKAHQATRKEFGHKNYITFLPEAEQARLIVQITLEDYQAGYKPSNMNVSDKLRKHVHRREIREEFDSIFGEKEVPMQFFNDALRFIQYECFMERNNIVPDRTVSGNIHVQNGNTRLYILLAFMNKLYWGDENLEVLTDEDKEVIKFYMLFNYNTLDKDEAAMLKMPYINDMYLDADEVASEEESIKEMMQLDRLKDTLRNATPTKLLDEEVTDTSLLFDDAEESDISK